MMAKFIKVAELQMLGEKHIYVNSGLIDTLAMTFPNCQIEVYCDSLHAIGLRKNLDNPLNVRIKEFEFKGYRYSDNVFSVKRYFYEIRNFLIFLKGTSFEKNQLILLFSLSPVTSLFANLFFIISRKFVIVCMHGDLGVLKLKEKHKLTTTVYKMIIRLFLYTKPNNLRLLFYGNSIKLNLLKVFNYKGISNSIAIDHPYKYKGIKSTLHEKPIIISQIGTGIRIKNSELIFKVAMSNSKLVEFGKIKFNHIGKLSSEVLTYSNDLVELFDPNNFVNSDSFETALSNSAYYIYFFSNNSFYDLCPSGTFFDAIKYCKPIIALENSFFSYYFKILGDIGYLCKSMEEIDQVIRQIADCKDLSRYNLQIENLRKAQETLSIKNISMSLKNQL